MDLTVKLLGIIEPVVYKNIRSWGHFKPFLNIVQENGDRILINHDLIGKIEEVGREEPEVHTGGIISESHAKVIAKTIGCRLQDLES